MASAARINRKHGVWRIGAAKMAASSRKHRRRHRHGGWRQQQWRHGVIMAHQHENQSWRSAHRGSEAASRISISAQKSAAARCGAFAGSIIAAMAKTSHHQRHHASGMAARRKRQRRVAAAASHIGGGSAPSRISGAGMALGDQAAAGAA